jgi:Leucine-rich repeat (LRR) protein
VTRCTFAIDCCTCPQVSPPQNQVTELSPADIVARLSGASATPSLHMIGHSLRAIPPALSVSSTLCHLALTGNQISSLQGLLPLPALTALEVSLNSINSLEPLPRLPALRSFAAAYNCISRTDDLNYLRRMCSAVTSLDLRGNAMTSGKTYVGLALRRLPHLVTLDATQVCNAQRQAAKTAGANTPVSELLCHCHSVREPAHLSLAHDGMQQCKDAKEALGIVFHAQHLRRVDALQKLQNLRWASLVDNEIISLHPLNCLAQLTQLNAAVRFMHALPHPCKALQQSASPGPHT